MKLSAKTRYAARILLDLARLGTDKPVAATHLSQHTGVSVQFIEQILKTLKNAGLTESTRGATGGHSLRLAPAAISLGDVVRIMEGGINLSICGSQDGACCISEDICPTRVAWMRVSTAMEEELNSISIQDLLDNYRLFTNGNQALFPVCNLIYKDEEP